MKCKTKKLTKTLQFDYCQIKKGVCHPVMLLEMAWRIKRLIEVMK